MIRTYEPSDGAQFETNTTFDTTPTLIVLHELSTYFLSPDTETSCVIDIPYTTRYVRLLSRRYTVSSYLSLVARALASVTFLSEHNDRYKF